VEERGFLDRDLLLTKDGFFFCVLGPIHPPDAVIAYPKYRIDGRGPWRFRGQPLARVLPEYSMVALVRALEEAVSQNPRYWRHLEAWDIEFTAVPHDLILQHFKPEERLATILQQPQDPLEETVAELVMKLSERSDTPPSKFGVTGSLLAGFHAHISDIDLLVYGQHAFERVRSIFLQVVAPLDPSQLQRFCQSVVRRHPLRPEDVVLLYRRRKTRGVYRGIRATLHAVKPRSEVRERYGEVRHHALGLSSFTGEITAEVEPWYTPAVYEAHLETAYGTAERVLLWESLYAGYPRAGDRVKGFGKVERITLPSGESLLAVVIGSREASGRDYIRVLSGEP